MLPTVTGNQIYQNPTERSGIGVGYIFLPYFVKYQVKFFTYFHYGTCYLQTVLHTY